MDTIHALTLHQPYASLIAKGVKKIETRGFKTAYRGPIAIHAGARNPAMLHTYARHLTGPLKAADIIDVDAIPFKAIVCLATLDDIKSTGLRFNHFYMPGDKRYPGPRFGDAEWLERLHDSNHNEFISGDYNPERYGWFLSNIFPLSYPCSGKQGIWKIDVDALKPLSPDWPGWGAGHTPLEGEG